MKLFLILTGAAASLAIILFIFQKEKISFAFNDNQNTQSAAETLMPPTPPQKSIEEKIAEALEKSKNIKGVYMTALVASSKNGAGLAKKDDIEKLLDETELNAVVIDVKEVKGIELNDEIKEFVQHLKEKNVWTVARIVLMRDSSQVELHPDWYIKKNGGALWRDYLGYYWLDPRSQGAKDYLANFSKNALDAGFDELQFDYIRYPSDGNLKLIAQESLPTDKSLAIAEFAEYLTKTIKDYKPDAIVSADLFGYIAVLKNDLTIGQRLEQLGQHFDYLSLMVYPSHFYRGLEVPPDEARGLPGLYFGYGVAPEKDVVAHPYEVVHRSMLLAQDIIATSTGKALMRPFLQDFNLSFDAKRGINYGPQRVRAQIKAAEDARTSGWLLWNSGNNYTKEALRKATST